MTHKELFQFIKNELEEQGFVTSSDKGYFQKLLPDEDYVFYSSNLSNWLNGKPGRINNNNIKLALQNRLGFINSVWNADTRTQKELIRKAVKKFMNPSSKIDLDELLPKNTPLSDEQADLLITIKKSNEDQTPALIESHEVFFKKTPENQIFLLKLFTLLFEKGMYEALVEKVFPFLLPHNATQNHIKIFKAHTLGSLENPDYLGAASLLQTVDSDSTEEILELQTGLISNIRRHKLEKDTLTKDELSTSLKVFIRYYTDVFELQNHHYYPGVNLMYMLRLSQLTSPDSPIITEDDLEEIYKDAQASIARGSSSSSDETQYYAKMSEIEFRLLLNKNGVDALLSNLLDLDQPSSTYVERTLRMMQFFVGVLKRFSCKQATQRTNNLLKKFIMVIEILEEYEITTIKIQL